MKELVSAPLDVEKIKLDFPILNRSLPGGRQLCFLDSAASAQRPHVVIDAIRECYEVYYANVHRGVYWLSEQSTDRFERARQTVARFFNAPAVESIVFTSGCTAAVNLIAHSFGSSFVKSHDTVLLTEMEHHANIVPWFQLRERTGCQVRFVDITDDGLIDSANWYAALEARPKIVAFTAVSNVLGTINPVADMVREAHEVGATVVVDAAQAAPHQTVDVQDWDADFVVFSGHKLMGPNGIGVLYGRPELLEAMPPFLGGGGMISRVSRDGFEPGVVPARFEAGTPPIADAIGLAAAIGYLENVGLDRIHNHETELASAALETLEKIDGIRLLGPGMESRSGIVSFSHQSVHAHDIAQVLDQAGVSIRAGHHCAMPLHSRYGLSATARASFYLYNTLGDVQQLADALSHGIEKLHSPRRRTRK